MHYMAACAAAFERLWAPDETTKRRSESRRFGWDRAVIILEDPV
jgi:hypothetical protein